jgi:hypothetical protein
MIQKRMTVNILILFALWYRAFILKENDLIFIPSESLLGLNISYLKIRFQ